MPPAAGAGDGRRPPAGGAIARGDRLLRRAGAVIGHSRFVPVHRFIYVVPARYAELPWTQRYEVARLLGRLNQTVRPDGETVMLLGPGRWGTESPDLGVPVHFAEINRVSVLCEIVTMRENLVPDVSLGTHFLNELIEMNVLYLALFPQQQQNELNERFFLESPNRLLDAVPQAARWQDVVRVVDPPGRPPRRPLRRPAGRRRQAGSHRLHRRPSRPLVPDPVSESVWRTVIASGPADAATWQAFETSLEASPAVSVMISWYWRQAEITSPIRHTQPAGPRADFTQRGTLWPLWPPPTLCRWKHATGS